MDNDSQVVTYIISALIAILASVGSFVKWGLPKIVEAQLAQRQATFDAQLEQQRKDTEARLEEQRKRLEAEIEEKRDNREFGQEEKKLEISLRQAEATEALKMLGDIVTQQQADKEKADEFIRRNVTKEMANFLKALKALEQKTEAIPGIKKEILEMRLHYQTLAGKFTLMSSLVEGMYEFQKHITDKSDPTSDKEHANE